MRCCGLGSLESTTKGVGQEAEEQTSEEEIRSAGSPFRSIDCLTGPKNTRTILGGVDSSGFHAEEQEKQAFPTVSKRGGHAGLRPSVFPPSPVLPGHLPLLLACLRLSLRGACGSRASVSLCPETARPVALGFVIQPLVPGSPPFVFGPRALCCTVSACQTAPHRDVALRGPSSQLLSPRCPGRLEQCLPRGGWWPGKRRLINGAENWAAEPVRRRERVADCLARCGQHHPRRQVWECPRKCPGPWAFPGTHFSGSPLTAILPMRCWLLLLILERGRDIVCCSSYLRTHWLILVCA